MSVNFLIAILCLLSVRVYAAETPEEGYLTATDNAVSISYKDVEDKIARDPNMQLRLAVTSKNGDVYRLYANAYTGEVIYYNVATGEAITTNPYDIGASETISASVKEQLLSQVVASVCRILATIFNSLAVGEQN